MSVSLMDVRKSALGVRAIGQVAKAVVESLESRTLLSSAGLNAWASPGLSYAPGVAAVTGTGSDRIIALADPNEAPTDISLSNDTIGAGLPAETGVGTLSTTDPNADDTFTYALVDGEGATDNGSFTIVDDQLQTATSLDVGSYSILVQTTDSGGLTFEKVFTVTVAANEAPTDISLDNDTIGAGLPAGTGVGTLSTTDPNPGDTFTYALVAGEGDTDNASFMIVDDQLQTATSLDVGSYSILVQTTDVGGLTFEKTFTVNVAANEAPTDISLDNDTIGAGMPAETFVGTFSTTDPNVGDAFTYALVDGEGATDNGSFMIVDDQLQTAASLDAGSYSILVQTTDVGGLTFAKMFTVTVAANEAPTDISLDNDTIAAGSPAETFVGTFSTTDPNAGDTFTYALVDGEGATDNGSFMIVDDQLQTAAPLDAGSYSILVQTTDQDGLSTQKNFTVTVTSGEGNLLGQFGMTGGKKAESLTLTDVDGDKVTFTLSGGGTGQVFGTDTGFTQVVLTGTTNKSVLTVKVKKAAAGPGTNGGDGEVTITSLTSDGLIKSIKASPVIVSGPVELNTLNQAPAKTTVTLQFLEMLDGSINAQNLPIKSLKLLNWQNTDETPDTLTAPSIGSVTVSGRKEKSKTLAIEFLPGNLDASVTTTNDIKSIKVAGGIAGAIRSGHDAKGKGIGSITATRGISGATVATSGSINTIKVGALLGSDILVGVAPDFDGRFAAATGDFVTPTAKLGTLTVTGAKLAKGTPHPAYVVDSNISAPNVGTITLLNVPADTADPIVHVLNDKGTLKIKQTKLVNANEPMVPKGTFKAPKDDAINPWWVVVTPAV